MTLQELYQNIGGDYEQAMKVLKEVNKTAGLILGVVKGLFAVFCIAAVALIAASMFDGTAFANAVNNSYAAGVVASIING